ncbi:hypothetical protein [Leptospira kmetyi]|uniref:hypothetical protein n=1 Tax=Leptospira kmetyi TaxID=408139 RepID=UPI00031C336F|nr:hypothetical protein [Leptospira kmetyi]EQA54462.1 hypothetical protein LEP1GSC052_2681 [Leptospira kmetyi serovar Malaysia str. Bejo-Iso9]
MKKILTALLLTLAFFFILREGSSYLYQSKEEARVYNTGLYFLTKTDLSSKHQSDSFLFPYALYKLNADLSPEEFSRLCTYIWILSGLLLVFYFGICFGHWEGIFIGFFVLLSPIVLIQKTWIGFPDHLTFFFSSATIILLDRISEDRRRSWYALLYIVLLLGAWNHFYQFSIIVFLLILVRSIHEKKLNVPLTAVVAGTLLVARILSILLFQWKGIVHEDSRLTTVTDVPLSKWIEINTIVPHLALFSFLNGNVVLLAERIFKRKFQILIPFSIAAVVTFFTYDTTRVFVHLFYPSWFLLWLYFFRDEKSEFEARKKVYFALLALSLFILLLVPRFFIEAGGINYLLP